MFERALMIASLTCTTVAASWGNSSRRTRTARETFSDQDRADVATVGPQRPAVSSVVARELSLRSGRAGALDVLEVEVTSLDKLKEALRGLES